MSDQSAGNSPRFYSRVWFAALVPGLLGVTLCFVSAIVLQEYGWTLFLLAPLLVGMASSFLYNLPSAQGFWPSTGVAFFGFLASGALILLAGLDGLMCLVMAAPLAFVLLLPGVLLGTLLANAKRERALGTMLALIASFPFLASWEAAVERQLPEHKAVSSVIIDAPPEIVWDQVVAFNPIKGDPGFAFRLGLAYPIEARIEGEGVGAVRHCVFSTGAFVEPITVWDPPQKLAFDVTEQPKPMHEISPYPGLHPPHLDHYFISDRGQFLLTRLPDGTTKLEGTTWYYQDLWPHWYWEPIATTIIQRIHHRVLGHIKSEAEASLIEQPE